MPRRDAPPLPFKTDLEGAVWPSAPNAKAQALMALLLQLEYTQWWDEERLRSYQFRQLARLLDHCAKTVPFYGARLSAAGYQPGRPLSEAVWARIPPLTREEVQDAGPQLHSTALPKAHGDRRLRSTSGSTGRPVKVVVTDFSNLYWQAASMRLVLWNGVDVTGTLAAIRGRVAEAVAPDGKRNASWGPPVNLLFETGPAVVLTSVSKVAEKARWLEHRNPTYLTTSGFSLYELIEHCRRSKFHLPNLRAVLTNSSIIRPETREACREAWGVPIYDNYSAEEVGYMALQCPQSDVYHVQAEDTLVEILDDDDRPCPPGRRGRVVVTSLHNFAMPMIRYEQGDFAVPGLPCACGRGLPVIESIVGRARDLLTLPNGERVAATFINKVFQEFPVTQFQIVQDAPDHLETKLVVKAAYTERAEGAIRKMMLERLPAAYRISFSYHEEIPRSRGGKYFDFISKIS